MFKKTKGAKLWGKLKLKSTLLFVNKQGFRNELYKLAVCGAAKTGKTLLCSHAVGCERVINSCSTDAHDLEQHATRHTLYDNKEHNIVLSDKLENNDNIVTVVHQDHPQQTIGYELSNGQTMDTQHNDATNATPLRVPRQHKSSNTPQQTRTKTNVFVTQINVNSKFRLQSLEPLEHVNSEEDSTSDHSQDMHDEDGNYIGGQSNEDHKDTVEPPPMYGMQLLDIPPCDRIAYNKRGKRIVPDLASQVTYGTIDELGIFPSKTNLLVRSPMDSSNNSGKKTSAKNPRNIPEPGSSLVTNDESNLLWRNCVAGSIVVLYNVMDNNTFNIAKDMLQAIRHDRKKSSKRKNVPVLVIGNYADLANHSEYDFDRDCELSHQYNAFYAYGSVLENRLVHQGQEYTVVQLLHRLVLTMRKSGLLLYGKPHSHPAKSGKNVKKATTTSVATKDDGIDKKDIDIHALVAKHKRASLINKHGGSAYVEEVANDSDGSWFGWCGGRT